MSICICPLTEFPINPDPEDASCCQKVSKLTICADHCSDGSIENGGSGGTIECGDSVERVSIEEKIRSKKR